MKYALAAILVIFASGCTTTGSNGTDSQKVTKTEASSGHKHRLIMPGKAANPRNAVSN